MKNEDYTIYTVKLELFSKWHIRGDAYNYKAIKKAHDEYVGIFWCL